MPAESCPAEGASLTVTLGNGEHRTFSLLTSPTEVDVQVQVRTTAKPVPEDQEPRRHLVPARSETSPCICWIQPLMARRSGAGGPRLPGGRPRLVGACPGARSAARRRPTVPSRDVFCSADLHAAGTARVRREHRERKRHLAATNEPHPNPCPPPPTARQTRGQSRRKLAAGLCIALSGCAGVKVLPDLLRECTPAGLAATKKLGLHPRKYWGISITNTVRSDVPLAIIREGPIEAKAVDEARAHVPVEVFMTHGCSREPFGVWSDECHGTIIVPRGAKLRGRARISGERVNMVFTELQLPGKPPMPFCGYAVDESDVKPGLIKNDPRWLRELGIDQLAPGTAVIDNGNFPIRRVEDLARPES